MNRLNLRRTERSGPNAYIGDRAVEDFVNAVEAADHHVIGIIIITRDGLGRDVIKRSYGGAVDK